MKSPAFQFYPADYLADSAVDMMTLEQQGAYWRLCCHAWRSTTVGRLFNDPQQLSALARMSPEQWEVNKGAILRGFTIDSDGFITQKRLVQEYEKQEVRRNQAVAAGIKSALTRSNDRSTPVNDRSTKGQRNANPSSSSSSSTSVSNPIVPTGDLFGGQVPSTPKVTPEDIYAAYPLKVGKPDALRAIKKAMDRKSPEDLLALTKQFSEIRGGDMAFVQHPATWFNKDRFNDDPETWKPNANNTKPNQLGFDRVARTCNTDYTKQLTAHLASEAEAESMAELQNSQRPAVGAGAGCGNGVAE